MVSSIESYVIPQARPAYHPPSLPPSPPPSPPPRSSQASSRERSASSPREFDNWRNCGSGDPSTPSTSDSQPREQTTPPSKACRVLNGPWRSGGASTTKIEWNVGQVVLLPFEENVPASSIARQDVYGDPWNHPAVITEKWKESGEIFVKIRYCTTFGGKGIEAKQEHLRHFFFEANRSCLAEGSDEFGKPSWVNCSPRGGTEISIEHDLLLAYNGKNRGTIRFNEAALKEFTKKSARQDGFDWPYDR